MTSSYIFIARSYLAAFSFIELTGFRLQKLIFILFLLKGVGDNAGAPTAD